MQRRNHWYLILLVLFFTFEFALASTPTSFCKCTCFGNSTIVALDSPVNSQKPSTNSIKDRAAKKTCNDCNRQFCLSYSFCKGEKEDNVLTACFQRDSAKDRTVVFIFIIATVGLLSYAAVRPWIDQWTTRTRERTSYIPVSGQSGQ
ncbi:hypothetical protein BU24DRAFT_422455 [Aaosphaeria arxii CBS 175.79]|uniref:Uncharacterized protein n=1 Tax=Aaosphaeria arxii CBS 175.79 TaxID=1450172 RepID=A0A6A5XS42_9PLEO|nr:uncharacterized protein BU24DRAFT_422455 [Aaosphaeria arxii CBS 175.79]KAF2016118.1 hypothetical protein BU24DRAFT_422455 [Aaosphaeria arxii CBS 175.79]